jgi:hypothetical protein
VQAENIRRNPTHPDTLRSIEKTMLGAGYSDPARPFIRWYRPAGFRVSCT